MADITAKEYGIKRVDKVVYTRKHKVNRLIARDSVVTEQPLQINLHWYREDEGVETKVFAITMRSLGNDKYLILGLLFSEGVIKSYEDIEKICPDNDAENSNSNSWQVHLVKGKQPKLTSIERFQTTYSSCGLCGATSLKALEFKNPPDLLTLSDNLQCSSQYIYTLSDKMRTQQPLFDITGGIHGAALFNHHAELLTVFEDIGRHNAVDKLIGHRLVEQSSLQSNKLLIMLVSGRVSFEIVQKAVMAGISILVAVGAPSELAIKAAQRFELTLIGFANADSFNLYHGDWRIKS
ncbi:MAG: formate dehydrogenase accessory sulfurtransferase FdhD [Colwellia sp.]|nr:formate dehydrogenase accessory sulfurtransferase FdhD [Colwellia sp.]